MVVAMRALLTATITDQAGNVVQGAVVPVYEVGTVTPVDDMFAASSGGSPITSLTSDARGQVVGWFDEARLVDLLVTDNGHTAFRPLSPGSLLTFADYVMTVAVDPDYAPRRLFDVVTYGATAYTSRAAAVAGSDSTAAIQAAHDAALAAGGGTVFLPPGFFKTTDALKWRSKVNLVGCGMGVSVLVGVNSTGFGIITNLNTDYTAFYSDVAPMTDVLFEDFEVDGLSVTNVDYATAHYKGFTMKFCKRVSWNRVHVHDTGATGIGPDFLVDCAITNCVVVNCGRENDGTGPGGAGIGIGTGGTADESMLVQGNQVRGNGRSGIFFERQTNTGNSLYTSYAKVINNHCDDNQYGIVNAGVNNFEVSGNTCSNNSIAGISTRAMLTVSYGGKQIIDGNICVGNTTYGIYVAISGNPGHFVLNNRVDGASTTGVGIQVIAIGTGTQPARAAVRGNEVGGCIQSGIRVDTTATGSDTLTGVEIEHNRSYDNAWAGIHVTGTGKLRYSSIRANHLYNNGQNPSFGVGDGIFIGAPVQDSRISDNVCYDDQSPKTQAYGINVPTVTLTDVLITRNDVRLALTSAMNLAGTLTTCTVIDNPGYDSGTTPWRVDVNVYTSPFALSGTWAPVVDTGAIGNGLMNSNDAQNNYIEYAVMLGKGTWIMELMHTQSVNRPIYTVTFDGAAPSSFGGSADTIDGHAGAGTKNVRSVITGIVFPTTARRLVRFTSATKNISSSGYLASLQALTFRRVA